jgi:hypothetical protein
MAIFTGYADSIYFLARLSGGRAGKQAGFTALLFFYLIDFLLSRYLILSNNSGLVICPWASSLVMTSSL